MSTFVPETYIQQVLQAVDIVDVIGSYVALARKGKEMVGLCPFHDDSKPSMNVSPAKQIFKCFACGAGGNVISFLMLRERLAFPEALDVLADRAGIELPKASPKDIAAAGDRRKLEEANRWAAKYFRQNYDNPELGTKAREYTRQRGLSEATCRRFGIGYALPGWEGLKDAAMNSGFTAAQLMLVGLLVSKTSGSFYDRFRDRLIFPVIDAMGRVIGFGGRTLDDDPAKYLNSPESVLFDKSRTLYGIHAAKDEIVRQRTAVIVEGYMDCIMAHQFEITNVVATLGTALTAEHARILSRYADKVILVFDSDQAGQKAADRAIDIFFSQRVEVRLVSLTDEKDPCDFLLAKGAQPFRELTESAIEALDYKWRLMQRQLDQSDSLKARTTAVEDFLNVIARAGKNGNMDEISEGFLLNRIAKLIGKPASEVHRRIHQLKRRVNGNLKPTESETPAFDIEKMANNSYEKAQQEILEVLLNAPELFPMVNEIIAEPSEFSEGPLAQIAQLIWNSYQNNPNASLAAILAGVQDLRLTSLLTEMAQRGAMRENYESTLKGAFDAFELGRHERSQRQARMVVSSAAEKYGEDAETAMLLAIQSKWRPSNRRPGAR